MITKVLAEGSESMRLLFINRYFYPDISATAQLLTELTEDLAAQGETITVITSKAAYTERFVSFSASRDLQRHSHCSSGIYAVRTYANLRPPCGLRSFWIAAFFTALRAKHKTVW